MRGQVLGAIFDRDLHACLADIRKAETGMFQQLSVMVRDQLERKVDRHQVVRWADLIAVITSQLPLP
jgi:hypothetical protein